MVPTSTLSVAVLAGLLWLSNDVRAQTRGEFFDARNRRHTFVENERTGKPHRIYPNIDAAELASGRAIGADNVESVSRKVLDELEILSRVDPAELVLTRARRSKGGMWIVTFNQQYQGLPVYGARYGVTIGRHNTVLSVGGDTYQIPRLSVEPVITGNEAAESLLDGRENAVVSEPELMIYPALAESPIRFVLSWVATVEAGSDASEVVIDANTGDILETKTLVAFASYSRTGTVDGPIYPRNDEDTREQRAFANLKVEALRLDYGVLDSDETDTSGDYSLSWTSATANHKVISELEGEYVSDVTDGDNSEISYSSATFSTTYSGVIDWTWSSSSSYNDQLNIFYHTNRMARWFEDFFNVTHKVKLEANETCTECSAKTIGGSTPRIVFSDNAPAERQADIILHEYAHSVSYKLHGSFIGSSGQAGALEEAMADYFAQTVIGDSFHKLAPTGGRDLDNLKTYPDDYSTSNSNHTNGLIPAGASWDLRTDLGASTADEIIFTAIEMDSPRADTFEEFFDNALLADDDVNGNGTWTWLGCGAPLVLHDLSPNANEIWDAFDGHGMPSSLLDEDPQGCHNPKPLAAEGVEVYSLVDAIPNPFNPSVTIRISVERPMEVGVTIYNSLGQQLRTLRTNSPIDAGVYSFTWDGKSDSGVDAATGTYLVRTTLGADVIARKITLLR